MNAADTQFRIFSIVVVLVAMVLRFWSLSEPRTFTGEEGHFIASVKNIVQHGRFTPDTFVHPPFVYYLSHGAMKLVGNNSLGWRVGNALLGTMAVALLILLTRELLSDDRMAVLAGALMAIEPMQILCSRDVRGEIPALFFALLAILMVVRFYKRPEKSLFFAGVCVGLTLATKWYYAPLWPLLLVLALASSRRENAGLRYLYCLSALVLLPILVYLLTYAPWFLRGYDLVDFIDMQADAYRELQNWSLDRFVDGFIRTTVVSPLTWITRPVVSWQLLAAAGSENRYIVAMNNFPIWLITIPAAVYTAYRSIQQRDRLMGFTLILFCMMFAAFSFVRRPLFLYSSIILMPLAYILISALLISVIDMTAYKGRIYCALLVLLFGWGAYLYPFAVGMPVAPWLYAPLLSLR